MISEREWLACRNPHHLLRHGPVPVSERKRHLFNCACCRRVQQQGLADATSRGWLLLCERYAEGGVERAEIDAQRPVIWQACIAAQATYGSAWRQTRGAAESAFEEAVRRTNDRARVTQAARRVWDAEVHRLAVLRATAKALRAAWAIPDRSGETAWESRHAEKVMRAPRPNGRPGQRTVELLAEITRCQGDLVHDLLGNPYQPVVPVDPSWLLRNGGCVAMLVQAIHEEGRFGDLPVLGDALEEAGCDNRAILEHCRGSGPHVRGCWVVDRLRGAG
jgi:hypothetical protein